MEWHLLVHSQMVGNYKKHLTSTILCYQNNYMLSIVLLLVIRPTELLDIPLYYTFTVVFVCTTKVVYYI